MQSKFFPHTPEGNKGAKTTLELTKERIMNGGLRQHHCRDLAHTLINYLCGKQGKFEKRPPQVSGRDFIQNTIQNTLLNAELDDNLFLLQVGKSYHSMVIERVNAEDSVKFIIYQSWYSTFTLDWWLGNDLARHNCSEEQHLLRERYGKGKKLSLEEINSFILILTEPENMPFSTDIGIAGTYKTHNSLPAVYSINSSANSW